MMMIVDGETNTLLKDLNIDITKLYRLYLPNFSAVRGGVSETLVAVASSEEELNVAREMCSDLTGRAYYVVPPIAITSPINSGRALECESISNADSRHYCRAISIPRRSECEFIVDRDLRHLCRAVAPSR